ncbi:MAG: thiol:disulfide interchange protein DsbD [Chitinophagaceae bacterium]|nr:thiol:disulfide interchange protein DsbD [Chitinophagaceae bacterium]
MLVLMTKRISLFVLFLCTLFSCVGEAQDKPLKPATWTYSLSKKEVALGQTIDLVFEATIDDKWYMYSSDFDPNLGPNLAVFEFEPNSAYKLVGKIKAVGSKKKYDDIWGGTYTYFKHKALFKQTVKIIGENAVIKGTHTYQVCTEIDGKCIVGDGEFEFKDFVITKGNSSSSVNTVPENIKASNYTDISKPPVDSAIASADADTLQAIKKFAAPTITLKERGDGTSQNKSLIYFIFIAFIAGIASLLTPCVFPMVPMTVTFFTNSSSNKKQAAVKAFVYGISIVLIYTLIGVIAARINGPAFANFISTHWIPNLLFTIIFIIFALSFLGMYEITLPSSFVNKVDRQADKGGYYGVFFMAFTIVLVSFSCTGPIVGTILVEAAGGELIKPVLGMLAYSSAFAIPFTLFALFPEWLASLPKSGGWLNVVKVTLGFIELALAIKFLSVADQVEHWGILDREVYLCIWIVIFALLGIYLLGKLRLSHDSPVEKISVIRLLLAGISLAFTMYLVPGLWGAPLRAISGYLPPMTTQDFNLTLSNTTVMTGAERAMDRNLCDATPKYSDQFKLPHGLKGYFEYKEAIACAKERNLPVFIDFTGHGCVNCRKMEANVWSDPEVLMRLEKNYVVVALYVDDHMKLPEDQWITSTFDGKQKKTIGAINADIQVTRYKNNAQPYYILLDPFTETVLANPVAFNEDVPEFIDFLDEGSANFKILRKK